MIPVLTPDQMRELDRYAIEQEGVSGIVLMERAGIALAAHLRSALPNGGRVAVVCGKGNNGGDGYVAARHLAAAGVVVRIFLTASPESLAGEAKQAFHAQSGIPWTVMDAENAPDAEAFAGFDLIADCLLGTGTKGAVTGFLGDLIERMNASGVPILACDIPSGLDGETGQAAGACIRAAQTLTIGYPKTGLLLYPGVEYVGQLSVANIGFPASALDHVKPELHLIEECDVLSRLPARPQNAHKGTFGRVFLVCGSRGMAGAGALAGEAALRVGAGLVTVGVPDSVNEMMQSNLREAICRPLPETANGTLARAAESEIRHVAEKMNVFGIGPGLSQNPQTVALVRSLLNDWRGMPEKVVMDADALNAAKGCPFPKNAVLTPHPGEMARLVDKSVSEVEANRFAEARRFSQENGVVLLLKGSPTVVASPDGGLFLNPDGNSGMATGGTGDVLTGVIAGLMGQGLSPLDAALVGAYVHAFAGDLAAADLGEPGMIAGDVLRFLPPAMKRLSRRTAKRRVPLGRPPSFA